MRLLSPTPTRHPSFRGVVLRSVLTPCPPSRNGRGSRGSAALPQRTGAQQLLEQHDSHLFSLALLPKHNMEDEGKRNMCPAHLSCRVFQDTWPRHVDSSLPPTPARVSYTVADEQHIGT